MRISSGETQPPSDDRAIVGVASSWRLGGTPGVDPADTDDVWPLEMWLSREEADSEADTWHARTSRYKRLRAVRRLRSSLAVALRQQRSSVGRADSIDL